MTPETAIAADPIDVGLSAFQDGKLAEAEAIFLAVLSARPDEPDALNFLGLCHFKQGRFDAARAALERAVAVDAEAPDAWYNLAEVLSAMKVGFEFAYERCVALEPAHPLAWHRLAQARLDAGRLSEAADAAVLGATARPADFELALWAAHLLTRTGRPAAALPLLSRGVAAKPDDPTLRLALFSAAAGAGDQDAADAALAEALVLFPGDAKLLIARVHYRVTTQRFVEALDAAKEFIRHYPDDPEGHFNLAMVFERQQELGAAAIAYGAVLELNPDHALTYVRLGEVLMNVGHLADAEATLRHGIDLAPDMAVPQTLLSIVLDRIPGRTEAAMAAIDEALRLSPDDAFAAQWRASLLAKRGRHAEAAAAYTAILDKTPDYAPANMGYGGLLAGQGQIERAWTYLSKAALDDPVDPAALGGALFYSNAHPSLTPTELHTLHVNWAARQRAKYPALFDHWSNDMTDPDRRLKIAYLSPDLRSHSVSNFLEPILSAHDKTQVEVIVLDNTPLSDPVSVHLHQFADRWVRIVGGGSDRICDIVRELKIDILVDLAGHTSDHRLDVFTRRPAPVQVSYLGYPNTTGLREMDYRLTDAVADPPGASDANYTETLVRLPSGFLCFNPPLPSVDVAPPSPEWPGITFGSFNAVHKINRTVIDLWTRVLDGVRGSRLLLKAIGLTDAETRRGILDAFADRGVDGDRLVLVERAVGYHNHLQVYHRCDIALDTFPYNGTTTTCEALWMGIPVVTLAGDRHSARVSLSILSQLNLTELAGKNGDEFVRIAVELAADRNRLSTLRATLRGRMQSSPLMNAKMHAAEIESAYRLMWKARCVVQPKSYPTPLPTGPLP